MESGGTAWLCGCVGVLFWALSGPFLGVLEKLAHRWHTKFGSQVTPNFLEFSGVRTASRFVPWLPTRARFGPDLNRVLRSAWRPQRTRLDRARDTRPSFSGSQDVASPRVFFSATRVPVYHELPLAGYDPQEIVDNS